MSLAKKFKSSRGFTLVELMIVVVIIGILAALAIYGVRQYVANAKTGEARMALGRIGKDAAAAFEAERMAGDVLALGDSVGVTRRLCATASNPVPAARQAEGEKYQPSAADWRSAAGVGASDPSVVGWTCLKFSMEQPIYFQYNYTGPGATALDAADGQQFVGSAEAEMGGLIKQLSITGTLQQDPAMNNALVLTVAPSLEETDTPLP